MMQLSRRDHGGQHSEEEVIVIGNAIQLELVFINLLINARDAIAIAERKRIAIACTRQANSVAIRFGETGPGIPAGLEQTIFCPFFTPQQGGAGTGLWLFLTHPQIKTPHVPIAVANPPPPSALFLIPTLP